MQRTLCNEICIKEVAEELGLSTNTVRKIVDSQFGFVKEVMESGTFDSIRLPYLGVFKSKPKEVQIINHLKGMTEDQAREFRRAVLTGKIRFNWWEKKDGNRTKPTETVNTSNGA